MSEEHNELPPDDEPGRGVINKEPRPEPEPPSPPDVDPGAQPTVINKELECDPSKPNTNRRQSNTITGRQIERGSLVVSQTGNVCTLSTFNL